VNVVCYSRNDTTDSQESGDDRDPLQMLISCTGQKGFGGGRFRKFSSRNDGNIVTQTIILMPAERMFLCAWEWETGRISDPRADTRAGRFEPPAGL